MTATDILTRLLVVIAIVALNGLFVAAEFAIVAVRRTRVDQLVAEGNRTAKAVQRAQQRQYLYLAGAQLGITMTSLGLGWVGEPALAAILEPPLDALLGTFAETAAHSIAIAIAFALITTLHIVLGEVAPKNLALRNPESAALVLIRPFEAFLFIFRPFIALLNAAGNFVVGLFGARPPMGHALVHSVEELKMLVSESREAGVLEEHEEEILERVFEFADRSAREIMVPRTEVIGLDANATLDEFVRVAASVHHSRLAVYEGDLDHIVGVAYLRDVIHPLLAGELASRAVQSIAREALILPETVRVDALLAEMKRRRTQLVVLVDEFGGTAGIVTLEDVMESIVGDVQDEFEPAASDIVPQKDGSAIVNGLVLIDEVNERFHLDLPTEDYDTIGGFVFGQLGRKPERGDAVDLEGARIEVEELDGLRIASVRIRPVPPQEPASA